MTHPVHAIRKHEMRTQVEYGLVSQYGVVKNPYGEKGWLVYTHVPLLSGDDYNYFELSTSRGEIRVFSTLDSAVKFLEEIGLSVFSVSFRPRG